jgi:Putative peptidoglycan binding domain
MTRRIQAIIAAALVALCAAPALSQTPPATGIELRMLDPTWLVGRTAEPPRSLDLASSIVDPVLTVDDSNRARAVARFERAGFVGGTEQTWTSADVTPPVRAWAAQFATPSGARASVEAVRWALRVRPDTASLTVGELESPADGRLFTTTDTAAGTRATVAFAAGTWSYGVEVAAPVGVDPNPTSLLALATQLAQRQPERPDPNGAQPLGVTEELRQALSAAHDLRIDRPGGNATLPVAGSVQAARFGAESWAMARFAGIGSEPELFRFAAGASGWASVGDPGGPGCPRIPPAVREVWGLTERCPLAPSAVARPDDPDALAVDDSAFQGLGMWVWEVGKSGGVDRIARQATASGIRTVFLKSGDGVNYWRQFDASVDALHASGLKVCGWQYIYGRRPVSEARVAARAVQRGADCFVVDAETEFEGGRNSYEGRTYRAARSYMRELRRLAGADYPIGMTSYAYVNYHSSFPYSAFLEQPNGADVVMPQVYWKAFGVAVDRAMSRTAAWNAIYSTPIAPIAGTYKREPPPDITRFRCLAAAYDYPGASYWSFQHTSAAQWLVVAQPLECANPPLPRPYPSLKRGDRGDAVVRLQARLRVWGAPVPRTGYFKSQTRAAVAAFQASRGLAADGYVGPLTWALLLEPPPAV